MNAHEDLAEACRVLAPVFGPEKLALKDFDPALVDGSIEQIEASKNTRNLSACEVYRTAGYCIGSPLTAYYNKGLFAKPFKIDASLKNLGDLLLLVLEGVPAKWGMNVYHEIKCGCPACIPDQHAMYSAYNRFQTAVKNHEKIVAEDVDDFKKDLLLLNAVAADEIAEAFGHLCFARFKDRRLNEYVRFTGPQAVNFLKDVNIDYKRAN